MNAKERNRLKKLTRLAREVEKFSAPVISTSPDPSRQKRAETLRLHALNRKKLELGWVLGNEPNAVPEYFLSSITLAEATAIIAGKLEAAKKEAISKLRANAGKAKKPTSAANGILGGRPKNNKSENNT